MGNIEPLQSRYEPIQFLTVHAHKSMIGSPLNLQMHGATFDIDCVLKDVSTNLEWLQNDCKIDFLMVNKRSMCMDKEHF